MTAPINNNAINGTKGPYDKNTAVGKGANAGQEAAKVGNAFDGDIQYAFNEKNIWKVDSTLAFSTEALKGLDSNGNGKLDLDDGYWSEVIDSNNKMIDEMPDYKNMLNKDLLDEKGHIKKEALFGVLDTDGNKEIDAAEYSAYLCLQDSTLKGYSEEDKKLMGITGTADDGILSKGERDLGMSFLLGNTSSKGLLTQIKDGYKLKDFLSKFIMPKQLETEKPVTNDTPVVAENKAEPQTLSSTQAPEATITNEPAPAVTEAPPAEEAPPVATVETEEAAAAEEPAAEEEPTPYTIKSGDTLWSIVKNNYGLTSGKEIMSKIEEIRQLNADTIKNINLIYAGNEIKLPR